ncbi:MAG TPA: hypothetical protein PLH57_05445, partial [Oligoflexia bacterium]|nr:hypothetical protein [Oligoflexia bacterium]
YSGEVGVESEDLFKLSPNFQRKLRGLMNAIEERDYELQRPVTYVSASKFSMEERSFERLSKLVPDMVSVKADLSARSRALHERLIITDPRTIVRLVELVQALAVAQTGKIVALPLPMKGLSNYTVDAVAQLDKFRKGKDPLRIQLGVGYEVYDYQLGQVVFYDPTLFWSLAATEEDSHEAISMFLQSLIGLAEVKVPCSSSDPRVNVVHYVAKEDSARRLVFLINPTHNEIHTRLNFPNSVQVAPLATGNLGDSPQPIGGQSFELRVPALGVLPMQIFDIPSVEGGTA